MKESTKCLGGKLTKVPKGLFGIWLLYARYSGMPHPLSLVFRVDQFNQEVP